MKWNFNWVKQDTQKPGRVGVYQTPNSLAAVYAIASDAQITVKAAVFAMVEELSAKQALLTKFVTDHGLQNIQRSYVLDSGEYSLNLVDAPLVPKEEVRKAIRWVIKDVVNFPIDDAIIDTFELPFPRAKDNVKLDYAVVMRKELIPKIESLIIPSGLELSVIDIPELVLKDMINRHPQQSKGCAFIQLNPKHGKLILCRNEQVCIARSFELKLNDLGSDPELDSKNLESLALEIQRSFDYLNSVFRQSVPNVVVLAPTTVNRNVIQEFLKNNLGSEVHLLKVSEYINFETPIKEEEEADYLLASCAVLRQQEAAA